LLLAACATAPVDPQPARSTPTALHLTITGAVEPVLGADGTGRIELVRDGTAEPIGVAFENGVLAIADLQPGEYSISTLGQLTCRGLTFEVDPSSGARALGSLQAQIVTTDYYVALMSRKPASGAEVAALAERTQTAPTAIDARPIAMAEAAPCFLGRGGPGTTWRDRPLGEQILLGIGFAGFCAVALASGGFCAF
jgi:hypothetical protein